MLRVSPIPTSWVLTDGKAGDELQCLGGRRGSRARAGDPADPARARLFTWAMPWGPIDPRERPRARNSPLAPPFPDLAFASGRRAVAYLRFVKKASGGRTFTVYLKDPRTGPETADLIWAPASRPHARPERGRDPGAAAPGISGPPRRGAGRARSAPCRSCLTRG